MKYKNTVEKDINNIENDYNNFMSHHKPMEESAIVALLQNELVVGELCKIYGIQEDISFDMITIQHSTSEEDMYLKIDFKISVKSRPNPIECQLKLKSLAYLKYEDLRASSYEINMLRSSNKDIVLITACLSGNYQQMKHVTKEDIITCCGLMITKNWNPFNQSYDNRLICGCDIAYDDTCRDPYKFEYEVKNPVVEFDSDSNKNIIESRYARKEVDYITDDCYGYPLLRDRYGNSFKKGTVITYKIRCLSKKGNKCFVAIPIIGIVNHLKQLNNPGYIAFKEHSFYFDFRK